MKLFMIELQVSDLTESLRWYETVGMTRTHEDSARGFYLLRAPKGGQIALKQGQPTAGTAAIVFEVASIPQLIEQLDRQGDKPLRPLKNDPGEGYEEIVDRAPAVIEVRFFQWT